MSESSSSRDDRREEGVVVIVTGFVIDAWITRESEDTKVFDERDMTILDLTCITISKGDVIEVLDLKVFREMILVKGRCDVEDEVEADEVENTSRSLDR